MTKWTLAPDGARDRVGPPAPGTGPAPGDRPGADEAAVVDAYPLTVLQTGMVFHQELDPQALPYHHVHSLVVHAPLDPALLRRAVRDVAERHPVLRTGFDLSDHEEPLQLVHQDVAPPLEYEDLRGIAPEKQERVLRELAEAERGWPFDVTRPPLVRLFAHRLTGDTFRWTQTEHRALLDGPSRTAFRTEVLDRYRRLLDDPLAPREPPPPPPSGSSSISNAAPPPPRRSSASGPTPSPAASPAPCRTAPSRAQRPRTARSSARSPRRPSSACASPPSSWASRCAASSWRPTPRPSASPPAARPSSPASSPTGAPRARPAPTRSACSPTSPRCGRT